MRQITPEHLTFMDEARGAFKENPLLTTYRNIDGDLIALRYGADRDCINIFELGDQIAFFAQALPALNDEDFYNSVGMSLGFISVNVREKLVDFAELMEEQLKRNEYKGGWEQCTTQFLRNELEKNFRLLMRCSSHEEYRRRCANIANFAMMLSDNDVREERESRGEAFLES